MPILSRYEFWAEVTPRDGSEPLGTVRLRRPDFEPAVQWAYLQRVRRSLAPAVMHCPDGVVEPVWDEVLGRPFVGSIGIRIGTSGVTPVSLIPTTYLRRSVEAATAVWVGEGRLAAGEAIEYRLVAHQSRSAEGDETVDDSGITVEPIPQPLDLHERALDEVVSASVERDASWSDATDVLVVIPQSVLEEVDALAEAAGELEMGGMLVGALCRDPASGDVFVEVRAQLPAQHGCASADRFTFTPDTWADARAAIALRDEGECLVGWHHSHPFFCRRCSAESRERCPLHRPFLSEHDESLHRTVFGRGFDVALLATDRGPAGRELALFGWRRGLLVRRGYRVSGSTAAAIANEEGATTRERGT
jgi:hypothetical protein